MRDSVLSPAAALRGTSLTELLVALALLGSIATLVLPVSLRIARQGQVHRQHCVALEELANHMEQLARMTPAQLQATENPLPLSPENAGQLPDAQIQLDLAPSDDPPATRVRLTITWTNRLGYRSGPLSLTAWVYDTGSAPEKASQ